MKLFVLIAILATGPHSVLSTSSLSECEKHQKYLEGKGTVALCVEQEKVDDMATAEKMLNLLVKMKQQLEKE